MIITIRKGMKGEEGSAKVLMRVEESIKSLPRKTDVTELSKCSMIVG